MSRHVRRGLSILSIGWLFFLLEPLSSTGLAFPFFLATFAITIVFGVVSLALELTRRPVNLLRILVWLAYPFAAATLVPLPVLAVKSSGAACSVIACASVSSRAMRSRSPMKSCRE